MTSCAVAGIPTMYSMTKSREKKKTQRSDGTQQMMICHEGAKKMLDKLTSGQSPLRKDSYWDEILKDELMVDCDKKIEPASAIHGCYCYPPIGGYATDWSGCDFGKGKVPCPWTKTPNRQAGCIARQGTNDVVRVLFFSHGKATRATCPRMGPW